MHAYGSGGGGHECGKEHQREHKALSWMTQDVSDQMYSGYCASGALTKRRRYFQKCGLAALYNSLSSNQQRHLYHWTTASSSSSSSSVRGVDDGAYASDEVQLGRIHFLKNNVEDVEYFDPFCTVAEATETVSRDHSLRVYRLSSTCPGMVGLTYYKVEEQKVSNQRFAVVGYQIPLFNEHGEETRHQTIRTLALDIQEQYMNKHNVLQVPAGRSFLAQSATNLLRSSTGGYSAFECDFDDCEEGSTRE